MLCLICFGSAGLVSLALLLCSLDQCQVARLTEDLTLQRVTALLIRIWRKNNSADLTTIAIFMEGASKTLHCVAVCAIFSGDDQHVTGTALWGILPVVVLKAIHLPNLSLRKSLLSNWLPARCTYETGRMIGSLQGTDHMVLDDLTTGPAGLQAGLVTILTERYSSFVVVEFSS